jgi:O-acetyl-ADP-ribose deacetylase (regulator of RNase III)
MQNPGASPPGITVVQGDITQQHVDAIVNAANETFRGGGGVDGAIHRAAGPQLLEECRKHPRLPTGEAIMTRGYRLPARFVIHTAGPIWQGGTGGEAVLLRSAYTNVFRVARAEPEIRTIAFPAISTGVYGYPKRAAATIAVEVMMANREFFECIAACVYSESDANLYREILGGQQS